MPRGLLLAYLRLPAIKLMWAKLAQQCTRLVRFPTKPAMHTTVKPATCSDPKPASVIG